MDAVMVEIENVQEKQTNKKTADMCFAYPQFSVQRVRKEYFFVFL